jgi:hypothetical protein
MSHLTFDPVEHRYTVNGVEYPSVTTILKRAGIYGEYSDVDPDILARAGVRGDIVHLEIAHFLETGIWRELSGYDDLDGYFDAFKAWFRWSDVEVWNVEHRTFSRVHQIAGTIDLVGTVSQRPSIIDFKTTRYLNKVAAGYQTAGYRLMYNEHNADRHIQDRYALHLRRDGTFRLQLLDNPLDELRFIGFVNKYGNYRGPSI